MKDEGVVAQQQQARCRVVFDLEILAGMALTILKKHRNNNKILKPNVSIAPKTFGECKKIAASWVLADRFTVFSLAALTKVLTPSRASVFLLCVGGEVKHPQDNQFRTYRRTEEQEKQRLLKKN
jgi:hypothetical protein